jgi:hypothetical protein
VKVLKTGIEDSCNGILRSDGMIHYDPMDFSPSWLQYMRKNVALAKHLEVPVSGDWIEVSSSLNSRDFQNVWELQSLRCNPSQELLSRISIPSQQGL